MKRYFTETISEHENGCLVLYDDHLAAIAERDKEIERLKAEVEQLTTAYNKIGGSSALIQAIEAEEMLSKVILK